MKKNKKNKFAIYLTTDENYWKHSFVSISSLLKFNKWSEVSLFFFFFFLGFCLFMREVCYAIDQPTTTDKSVIFRLILFGFGLSPKVWSFDIWIKFKSLFFSMSLNWSKIDKKSSNLVRKQTFWSQYQVCSWFQYQVSKSADFRG